MTWQQVVQRAQRHGWRVSWVGDGCIIVDKAFYRQGHKPLFLAVYWDGSIRAWA